MVSKMRYNTLGDTGLQVSVLSFGASSLGNVYRLTDEGESIQVVHEALKRGINYIDTAPWYGHGKSETVLGKALKDIPRDSYYIATKVCRYQPEVEKQFDFSAQRTIQSVDESLQRLGLPYVDFIQVHDMEFAPSLDIVINETLPALQKVKESGKARFIGITGYPLENFRTVIDRSSVKIDTVLTYCHGSMNDNSLSDFIPYFKSKGVGIVNASPISMGLLSDRGPPAWHPAHQHIKDVCAAAATFCSANGVDISRLAMDFTLSQPDYDTTLVSTASLKNLYKNIESVYCPLTDKEKTIQQQVLERYMKPLKNRHWEGVEVEQYRKELAAVQ
ncbi:L-galactose dehydrogenase-like isoform X2 [Gigantopelta aegis]|nr:L-galactose dehydrogenase-like isoform X2 [Gigantopelta aegis]